MIESFIFKSTQNGPRLVFFGAVHGNEICGTKAQQRLIGQLESGEISLLCGSLLCIPVINQEAYKSNCRYIDVNLNRVFDLHSHPTAYEHKVANEVIKLVADCDVLLDFHSITSDGVPFTFRFGAVPPAEEALLQDLGLPVIVEGWIEAYAASLPGVDVGQAKHTHAYFRERGKIAAGIECGRHGDPAAVEVAYLTMLRALRHFGMIELDLPAVTAPRAIRMQGVYFRKSEQDKLVRSFKHGDVVTAGEVIAVRANGDEIKATMQMLVLLPRPNCPVNEEWFYLGQYAV